MNDYLSDDIKKKFMLPLTIELQDHKKVFLQIIVVTSFSTHKTDQQETNR